MSLINNDKSFFKFTAVISIVVIGLITLLYNLPDSIRPKIGQVYFLPKLNALFNSMVAICLVFGLMQIKKKNIKGHRAFMLSAFLLSSLFLVSYVIFHLTNVTTKYPLQDWTKTVYFIVLLSHILLSALILPMVLITFYYAATNQITKHRRLAKYTFPIWLYVAVTGVIVYLMISPYYNFV